MNVRTLPGRVLRMHIAHVKHCVHFAWWPNEKGLAVVMGACL